MAHKDQKDDKKTSLKKPKGSGKDSAPTPAAVSPTEIKSTKAIKYPLPVVRFCPNKCVSPFQDDKYGSGMRLHNPCASKTAKRKNGALRCTVCKHEQD